MQRSSLVPIVGFVVIAIAAIVALLLTQAFLGSAAAPDPSASPGETAVPSPSGSGVTEVSPSPSADASPTLSAPSTGPTPDPRLAFAEFVVRLADARDEANVLLDRITAAAQAGDTATVRSTALGIDALVDRERGWLADHPPAACYAQAHRDTDAMYAAFGRAADAAVAWADADGLAAIPALIDALAAADAAITSTETVAASVGRVDCS